MEQQDEGAIPESEQPVLSQSILEQVMDLNKRGAQSEAFALLTDYVNENPYHGDFWHELGEHYERAQQYEEAREAYLKAVEYGNRRSGVTEYQLARTLVRLGRSDEAVGWLEKSFRLSLRSLGELDSDALWQPLRSDPRFAHLFTPTVTAGDRIAGWRADLAYLKARMEQAHYDLFGRETPLSRETWEAEIAQLDGRIPELEDHEIVVGLMKIVALAGDGHTNLFPFDEKEGYVARQKGLFEFVPAMFYLFQDGLFVRAAAEDYANAVGARVLRIGNTAAEQALERISPVVFQDNSMQVKRQGPLLLACPAILHALGMAESHEYLDVLLQHGQEEPFSVRFQKDASVPEGFVWRALEPEQWKTMRSPAQPKPLWLKHSDDRYWFEYLEEHKIVYCQYNAVRVKEEESLEAFSERLFACVEANDVRALVLDLRLNGGGDLTTHRPLLHGVIGSKKINQRGRLFAIISRHTFSAAQNFTNQLDIHTRVTFVGEPSGSRPQFVGEGNSFTLPFSGMSVNASNVFWQGTYGFDRRLWIPPDIRAELTSHDYRTNRDPALESILAYL